MAEHAFRDLLADPQSVDSEGYAELLESAARIAYSLESVEDALQWALDHVCAFTGWPVGHALLTDAYGGGLVTSGIWHLPEPGAYASFVEASTVYRFDFGKGLPGRVLQNGQPAWIVDVRTDSNFPRHESASECGLAAAFAFPIVTSGGVSGVLEFFALESMDPADLFLRLISNIGETVGHVIEQLRARDELAASEARLAEAQRLARMGSWSWSVGMDRVHWSDELYRIYGVQPDSKLTFDTYLSRVHPDDADMVSRAVEGTLTKGEAYEHEYRIVLDDGGVRWVSARGDVVQELNGIPERLAGYCQDITEAKVAEAERAKLTTELFDQRRVLERIARGETLASVMGDLCHVFEANHAGARCTVLRVDERDGVLRHVAGPSLPAAFLAAIDGLAVGEGNGACGTAAARNETVVVKDTLTDPLTADFVELAEEHGLGSIWSVPLTDVTGTVTGTFAVYRSEAHEPDPEELSDLDVARHLAAIAIDRHRAEEALTEAAQVDPLTGLPNRTQFLERLGRQVREPAARIGVLVLDIDLFKWINDSLGHPAGDRVLVEAANRLRAVAPESGMLSRFGGDEFLIMLTDATDTAIEAVAAGVEEAFAEPFVLDSGEFFLSVSTGIAVNDHDADAAALVRDADAAMFQAKEAGRARHVLFDERLRQRAVTRVTMEADLRRAIERREITLHYQPIVDVERRRWSGVEALARWPHPTRGFVQPADFIPLAEETGLIIPLGLQILEQAVADAGRLANEGINVTTSANISVAQLTDPTIPDAVAAVLERHGVAPERLVLEVTETAVMEHFDVARDALARITDLGVYVVIDDFGTGYSSIARLGELPVACVKIDRSFTMKLGVEPQMPRIFAAITDLAHALDLRVVAEGIETDAMLDAVAEVGCDYAQGYLFARPMPVEEVRDVLRKSVD